MEELIDKWEEYKVWRRANLPVGAEETTYTTYNPDGVFTFNNFMEWLSAQTKPNKE